MDLKNQAVVLVRAGIAKKIGRPHFSAYEANCQIEMSVDLGMVTDAGFPQLLGDIYDRIQKAVDQQIAEEVGRDQPQATPQVANKAVVQTSVPTPVTVIPAIVDTPVLARPPFRDFLLAKATELAVGPQGLVKHWYKSFVDGNETEFVRQGKVLADLWDSGSIGPLVMNDRLTHPLT
jgi:hypothetical protein